MWVIAGIRSGGRRRGGRSLDGLDHYRVFAGKAGALCDAGRLGRTLFHAAVTLKERAVRDDKALGDDVAGEIAARHDLNALDCGNLAGHLARDQDAVGLDVADDRTGFADDDAALDVRVADHIAVDADRRAAVDFPLENDALADDGFDRREVVRMLVVGSFLPNNIIF